ncbi:IPT/TIG domain-containing protein [Janthinobacterium fluminis]|uniref:IPT/TIG domain-containing protein n=1 Tax=Janthinobacterium fluminis TaxID=2987524 RepID=A0ABT5K9Y0_9BURK|nr:IPT/TIG domain-containing protein [Janthinobacterium fluminis]MDC8760632.1 IPT/TIG domain-containing protein [Janthinobacterium fluminis]
MKNSIALVCVLFGLAGCGGGGGGGDEHKTTGAVLQLSISGFAPAAGIPGSTVTVTGTGLKTVTEVRFSNGTLAQLDPAHTDTSATFLVPADAASGPLSFTGTNNRVVTTAVYTVGKPMTIASVTSKEEGGKLSVLVLGKDLGAVTTAKVGAASATIDSQSDTKLQLTVPAGSSGGVVLASAYEPAVAAGAVVSAQNFTVGAIDLAQVYNAAAMSLTPGKPVLVRAPVLAAAPGLASPDVKLVAYAGDGSYLGSLKMQGPANIPVANTAEDINTTFNAVLPAAWVKPKLQVFVTAGAGGLYQKAEPLFSVTGKIRIVLVPMITAGQITVAPDVKMVKDALVRTYPYAAKDITVEVRKFAFPVLTGSSSDYSWWETTLDAVEALRLQEDPSAYYYALSPTAARSSNGGPGFVVGLGYIGKTGRGNLNLTAMGIATNLNFAESYDPFNTQWPAWLTTLVHEVGHNHSLSHVPCGNVAGAVVDYPYTDGNLGPQPLYNQGENEAIGQLSAPSYVENNVAVPMKDVMSYCKGAWFSDYSYKRAQQFAESRNTSVATLRAASVAPAADGYLTISGQITANGVRLRPALATATRLTPEVTGNYHEHTLRVHTVAGETFDLPFDAAAIGDGQEGSRHFRVSLANPGEIASVEVLAGGRSVPQLAQRSVAANVASAAATASSTGVDWKLKNGKLELQWNASAEPYASVLYIAPNGVKTVLASALTGGAASLDVRALPAGGKFDVSLATNLKARLVSFPNK